MSFESLIVDQSTWGQVRMSGSDRVRFLQGMCTSNIESLRDGNWVRASMLTPKGRVVSVFDVVAQADALVLVCEPQLVEKTIESLGKYAIVDDVEFEKLSLSMYREWKNPEAVWTAAPIFGALPGPAASAEAVEVRRVEAGMPSYGQDVSEDYFPFESGLASYIDYEKGCYVGQEPVARVHSRGSANKVLRGLIFGHDAPVAEVGAAVDHPDKAGAGKVTSAVRSPVFGSIAMAYVHRSVWEPGGEVTVAGQSAKVAELPLGDSEAR